MTREEHKQFEDIMDEMKFVYLHDDRPWMIGFSGGKDSTMLCCLVMNMLKTLRPWQRKKTVHIVSSDTMVENPIVKEYMHRMSELINKNGKEYNVKAHIIYPEIDQTFWCRVIGLGYPTPEAPGFRWCTDRLKIKPMNEFTINFIKNNGEVVLLLGVRKAESTYRANNIKSREIDGKLLIPHSDIENAYVYNPLTEIPNNLVWDYLLNENEITPWGSSNKELFNLYQGENLGEEKSVIGEIDKDKIPVTGNSRFGCWICTMVKEDKSLKNFIDAGETWLIPLRDFRNKLLEMRNDPSMRDKKRRNGSVYQKGDGSYGFGPFTLKARAIILKELLELQRDTKLELITTEELKTIDKMWENEGDLTRRKLVDIYYEVMGKRLPWDEYKTPIFDNNVLQLLHEKCIENDVEFELISKLIVEIENNKHYAKNTAVTKAFDRIINQGWLHENTIQRGLNNED